MKQVFSFTPLLVNLYQKQMKKQFQSQYANQPSMIRGHVVLSLYFLVGMIVIVDMYVACVYMNNYFGKTEEGQGRGKNLEQLFIKDASNPRAYLGFGTDYGFVLIKSPPGAFEFPYKLTPGEDSTQLNISAPVLRLTEENISAPEIMNYVSRRILDHHNFRKARVNGRLQYYGHLENIPKSGLPGVMWVRKEVVESMQIQFVTFPPLRLMAQ